LGGAWGWCVGAAPLLPLNDIAIEPDRDWVACWLILLIDLSAAVIEPEKWSVKVRGWAVCWARVVRRDFTVCGARVGGVDLGVVCRLGFASHRGAVARVGTL